MHYEREVGTRGTILKLESKDLIRKRHRRSPDFLDSFVLACRETAGRRIFSTWNGPESRVERNRRLKNVLGFGRHNVTHAPSISDALK